MRIRRVVDLSHGVDDDTPVYPGDPEPSFAPAATLAEDGYNVLHVRLGSQTGTHVDAPYHFVADGARVDELDLLLFVGPATVVRVRGKAPRAAIGWADLAPHTEGLDGSRMLLLDTGWSRHWGTPRYFDHPYLGADAAERLVAAGVRTVGIDALSLDETVLAGPQPAFAAHHAVLGAGGVIVENLTNLAAVDWAEPLVSVLPLRLVGADGAPVRAVALDVDVA
jgi:kynurenine formamidase